MTRYFSTRSMLTSMMAFALMTCSIVGAVSADDPKEQGNIYQLPAGQPLPPLGRALNVRNYTLPAYWIGVGVAPAGDALKAQLDLESGVTATQVMKDSPADKAGIQVHDVLLTIEGKAIVQSKDLLDAIGETEDKEVEIELVRLGKRMKLKVKPAKRPEPAELDATAEWRPVGPGGDGARLEGLLQQYFALPNGKRGMMFFHPPMLELNLDESNMPKNLDLHIQSNKGKMEVQIDGKRYELNTMEDVNKLPKEVRPWLGRFQVLEIPKDEQAKLRAEVKRYTTGPLRDLATEDKVETLKEMVRRSGTHAENGRLQRIETMLKELTNRVEELSDELESAKK